ncbi:MAG: hypothetical protein IJK18_04275 [Clostridia bacterium]|nr:hypothetical protein [Clostridia bacterium]
MSKTDILDEYKNQDERLLAAKILDKLEFTKIKNKIQYTDFLTLNEQEMAIKLLKKVDYKKYYFFGGKDNVERKILVIYPEKLTEEMSRKNDEKIISLIRIKLPSELEGQYDHRKYLGSCIKVGIEREKIGDILVERVGADIIAKCEVIEYLLQNLSNLTRFKSAEFSIENISELKNVEVSKVEISSVVISLRLDNIVSTLAKTSRSKAQEILKQERVFLNHQVETKASKEVKVGDAITIRGKGRFEFREIAGNTRKGRFVIKIDKYV